MCFHWIGNDGNIDKGGRVGKVLHPCIVEFIVYVVSEGKGFDRVFGRVLTALQMLLNIAIA